MDALAGAALLFGYASLRYLPVMVLPGLSPLAWAPILVRISTMLAFAWLTLLALPADYPLPAAGQPMALALAAVGELMIGGVFGLGFLIPNAALHTSGWLLDMQAGLGAGALLNPASADTQESLLGHALMLAAMVLFFSLDLHVVMFKGLIASTSVVPLGRMSHPISAEGLLAMFGSSFLGALMVVMPVVLGLFLVDVAVGYASRSMPQANMYFLALPLKVAVALGLLALTLAYAPGLIGRLFGNALSQAPSLLGTP
ncbi:flagellar biosynthetic protein FliR [Xanthomonas cucurbitae]|uniref:Flagellar biosynthetic protein FliR n=1 Tax=Xanthomonas cucurbitae TaxID=56453 RepID=A0ABY7YCT7_9XANT|nr:flagellar biosynthetic protein FliR [Xanthomonas cucurbitae]WDM67816.1 flagellar biosynthetic protein FliR [Xanthomonas cucurbitae]WDM71690.1 flagellar biosynthetic protein FliR [Xanthomonas cucurbitae]